MYAQRGKEQIPQFPQLTEQPSTIIFMLNFRSSRETPQAGNDLVCSQTFSPLLPQTLQHRLMFSNTQRSQELLGVSLTHKIRQHRLQSSRTKHTLFPFSICTGSSAPRCSQVSHCCPLTVTPRELLPGWTLRNTLQWQHEQAALQSGSSHSALAFGAAGPDCSVYKWKWLPCEEAENEETAARKAEPLASPCLLAAGGCPSYSGGLWSPAGIIASFAAVPCYSSQMPQWV